jgi:hypothetical protein
MRGAATPNERSQAGASRPERSRLKTLAGGGLSCRSASEHRGIGAAENLVFEFDEAYTSFVEGFETLPTEEQLVALQAVDTHVSSMVDAKDAALWTEGARREAGVWQDIRTLAERVLEVFDWPRL